MIVCLYYAFEISNKNVSYTKSMAIALLISACRSTTRGTLIILGCSSCLPTHDNTIIHVVRPAIQQYRPLINLFVQNKCKINHRHWLPPSPGHGTPDNHMTGIDAT